MVGAGAGRLALIIAGFTFLTACEEGQEFKLFDKPLFSGDKTDTDAAGASDAAGAVATIEKDVESPEVFQKADQGLWDGRPSLGGVWIAHPDVTDPERVIIRNENNGKSIIGALFRRERENPGPRFQVSSDAASELGMLAGAPVNLNVTAMRRVAVPVAAPTPPPLTEQIATPEPISQAPIVDAEEAKVDPVAAIAASAIEAATAATTASTATATTAATATTTSAAPAKKPAPLSAPTKVSSLEKPYIQIGIFSVQSNAKNTSDLLRKSGVIPTTKQFTSNGKKYWRVIVGPAVNKSERSALIKKVQGLGFGDAYSVTN